MITKPMRSYTGETKAKLDKIFEKIELFYPEKKIFSFDSLCGKQRESLLDIAVELGTDYRSILNDNGYEIINRNEAFLLRPAVVYIPGNEPDFIKKRISNILKTLADYYPQKTIETSIDKEHKKLANSISGLAVWLGYKTTKDFLNAYGYAYVLKNENTTQNDALQCIEVLKNKYCLSHKKPQSITEIENETPEFKELLRYLKRNARELF